MLLLSSQIVELIREVHTPAGEYHYGLPYDSLNGYNNGYIAIAEETPDQGTKSETAKAKDSTLSGQLRNET